jgi:hypothetical protein
MLNVCVTSSDFNKSRIWLKNFFVKTINIKLHENPSSGSRGVPGGQT